MKKVTYIPNFVNKEKWHPLPAEQVAQLRKEMDLAEDQFVIGAGQVQKRKGIDDFIRLAEELPEITFIWAGGFSFGGMTDGYERYKEDNGQSTQRILFSWNCVTGTDAGTLRYGGYGSCYQVTMNYSL